MRNFVAAALATVVVSVACSASAQERSAPPSGAASSDGSPSSQAHFRRGLDLAREREYERARVEFEQALADDPPLEAYFGLGQVELALGKPCAAVVAYEKYLELGDLQIDREKRLHLERHVLELRKNAASPQKCQASSNMGLLNIACSVSGVDTSVDGQLLTEIPESGMSLEAGSHQVEFTNGDNVREVLDVDLMAGAQATIVCSPALAPGVLSADEQAQRERRLNGSQKGALTVTGIGVATGIAALTHYFWNRGRHDVYQTQGERLREDGGSDDEVNEYNSLGESIEKGNRVSAGLAIGSAVLTATGITWFVLATKKRKSHGEADTDAAMALGLPWSEGFLRASAVSLSSGGLQWSGSW